MQKTFNIKKATRNLTFKLGMFDLVSSSGWDDEGESFATVAVVDTVDVDVAVACVFAAADVLVGDRFRENDDFTPSFLSTIRLLRGVVDGAECSLDATASIVGFFSLVWWREDSGFSVFVSTFGIGSASTAWSFVSSTNGFSPPSSFTLSFSSFSTAFVSSWPSFVFVISSAVVAGSASIIFSSTFFENSTFFDDFAIGATLSLIYILLCNKV
jgi:hypothetical protein